MAHYAVYHMNIQITKQRAINLDKELAEPIKQAPPEKYHEILDSVLTGKFTAHTIKNNQEVDLECMVEKKFNDVILLIICNEKNYLHDEKKEKANFTYHPGAYVIIDNRPGKSQIAIESNDAFNNNPDKICCILQNAINQRLKEYQLELDIRARMIPLKFWDAINLRRSAGDTIRRVIFDFPDPNRVKNIPSSEEFTKQMAILHAFTAEMGAAKGSLKLDADKDSALLFEQTQQDIAQMVQLCCRTGYKLAVYFKEYGLYRYGKDIRQYGNIKESYIEEFVNGHTMLGNTDLSTLYLINWLDKLVQSSENFTYEKVTPKKRKNSYKK